MGTTASAGATEGWGAGNKQGRGTPGSAPLCGPGPTWGVCEALPCARGRQRRVVPGLLLFFPLQVRILGVGTSLCSDSREGSVLVPLQGTWPSPPAQPSEWRFLPVLWSPVLQQRLCSHGQQELQLPGC